MRIESALDELLEIALKVGKGEVTRDTSYEAFDHAFCNFRDADAFNLLSRACQEYDRIRSDEKHLGGFLFLLKDLVYSANTTEMPDGMRRIISENPEEMRQIRKWYRLDLDDRGSLT